MNNTAVSLGESPTLGFEDSFAFLVSDIATLLPLSHLTHLLLHCLTPMLALRDGEAGVTERVGRPHHLTHLVSGLTSLALQYQD